MQVRVDITALRSRGGQLALHAERVCWLLAICFSGICVLAGGRIWLARESAASISLSNTRDTEHASEQGFGARAEAWAAAPGKVEVVGRVEIPAIGLKTPLLAGDDSMSLSAGAGHIPGTAYPGGLGTVGIAGHRDTHFRLLKNATSGMDVRLIDRSGTYHYRVTRTEIVTPEQVSVLDIESTPGLVLITCYPFSYIGKAPKRFVVHAELLSVAPDETPAQ